MLAISKCGFCQSFFLWGILILNICLLAIDKCSSLRGLRINFREFKGHPTFFISSALTFHSFIRRWSIGQKSSKYKRGKGKEEPANQEFQYGTQQQVEAMITAMDHKRIAV